MASRSLNLYVGVTNSVYRGALQHKSGEIAGFTKRYHINRLVYYEPFQYVRNAIAREKQIKGWPPAKKLALIKSVNPTWPDLAEDWGESIEPLKPLPNPKSSAAKDSKASNEVVGSTKKDEGG